MKLIKEKLKFTKKDKALVVSDIHLRLPVTKEQEVIQKSLVERIKGLSKIQNATLILNGDIFELWEGNKQNVGNIIDGFKDLTNEIQKFTKKKNHNVIFVVGNHDEAINTNDKFKKALREKWFCKICNLLEIEMDDKNVRIEHGHEYDPYNKTTENAGKTHGKSLVQYTLPKLTKYMPRLFTGIGDVVNRAELPGYAISNLMYKIVFPIVLPLTFVVDLYLLYSTGDRRFLWAFGVVWLAVWSLVLLLDWILEIIAGRTFGSGQSYMRSLDSTQSELKFDYLILGHTHDGGVVNKSGYVYGNSGCNDIIVKSKYGFLGIYKFKKYIQLSGLYIDASKKNPLKYQEKLISLIK